MIKIAFFEDHPLVLKSLTTLFEENKSIQLEFFASKKEEFYQKLKETTVDIIIIDFLAVDVVGLELYEYVSKNYPEIKIISLTSLSSPIVVENLLAIGVKGYVNKNQDIEDVIEAIEVVYNNEIYLPEDYAFLKTQNNDSRKVVLSSREIEIIRYISKEYTTNDIAEQLDISVNTVENHRKAIFLKLNVKNVAGMVREAANLGYLE